MNDNILTFLVTVVGVLGSSAAWKFYERRLSIQANIQNEAIHTGHLFREDLQERVSNLESKLYQADKDKNNLQLEIRKLTQVTAALKVEVEFLRKENTLLRELYEKMGGKLPILPPKP